MDQLSASLTETKRGRRERLSQEDFQNTRNHLYGLFDQTWCGTARPLADLNSEEEIPQAFEIWRHAEGGLYVLECLLRPGSEEDQQIHAELIRAKALGVRIAAIHSEIVALGQMRLDMANQITVCKQRIDRLSQIAFAEVSEEESILLRHRSTEFATQLAEASARYDKATESERVLSNRRNYLHAKFAKLQLLEFCRNNDYEKNPKSLAKALAGLPFIGWRRSVARSRDWFGEVGGVGYRIFKTIERIDAEWDHSSTLSEHSKKWLQESKSKHRQAIETLKANWYFLKQAIDAVLACPPRSERDRARWIAAEYYRRSQNYSHHELELKESFALQTGGKSKSRKLKIEV